MGYYSELAIEDGYREDHSYPSPELQLQWRIEDLQCRLEDIAAGNCGVTAYHYIGYRFSEDDLAYAPPEYFSRTSDIMEAISIAAEKLARMEEEMFEISRSNETIISVSEEIPRQLTIWDILSADIVGRFELELNAAA